MGRASKAGFCVALRFPKSSPPTTAALRIRRFHSRTQNTPLGVRNAFISNKASRNILAIHRNNKNIARFSSRSNNESKSLSRKERRLLERKERNKAKRQSKIQHRQTESNDPKSSATNIWKRFSAEGFLWERLQNSLESIAPRLPGRNVSFTHRSLWIALGMRLPLVLALSFVLTNENTSPYVIQGSLGPSMLPTIQFVGDIWLVETRAWKKAMDWIFGSEETLDVRSMYSVGDLVIWEDTSTGKRSCKRIVGLEGDVVDRYGEYKKLYKNRSDGGVLWPKKGRDEHVFGAFSRAASDDKTEQFEQPQEIEEQSHTIVVPKECVWLEGDCPLFSMDSRYVQECFFPFEIPKSIHLRTCYFILFSPILFETISKSTHRQYGPIHSSRIRGRLVFRLWPWNRDDLTTDDQNAYLSSCRVSEKRPIPYPSIDAYVGKRFGLYRVEANPNGSS